MANDGNGDPARYIAARELDGALTKLRDDNARIETELKGLKKQVEDKEKQEKEKEKEKEKAKDKPPIGLYVALGIAILLMLLNLSKQCSEQAY